MTGTFPLCKSILIAGKKVISLKDKAVKTTDLSWVVTSHQTPCFWEEVQECLICKTAATLWESIKNILLGKKNSVV